MRYDTSLLPVAAAGKRTASGNEAIKSPTALAWRAGEDADSDQQGRGRESKTLS